MKEEKLKYESKGENYFTLTHEDIAYHNNYVRNHPGWLQELNKPKEKKNVNWIAILLVAFVVVGYLYLFVR